VSQQLLILVKAILHYEKKTSRIFLLFRHRIVAEKVIKTLQKQDN